MATSNNVIYRSKDRPVEIDAPSLFVNALTNRGVLTQTGAAAFASTGEFSGLLSALAGLKFVGTVTTGTAFTMTTGMSFFFGSQNSQAVVLPSAVTMAGCICFVTTAGNGTITLTGNASQTWGGNGTGTITPGKYWLGWSDGANWRTVIASL